MNSANYRNPSILFLAAARSSVTHRTSPAQPTHSVGDTQQNEKQTNEKPDEIQNWQNTKQGQKITSEKLDKLQTKEQREEGRLRHRSKH